jgi:hypothetical protein
MSIYKYIGNKAYLFFFFCHLQLHRCLGLPCHYQAGEDETNKPHEDNERKINANRTYSLSDRA